jgi:hypothetical protein
MQTYGTGKACIILRCRVIHPWLVPARNIECYFISESLYCEGPLVRLELLGILYRFPILDSVNIALSYGLQYAFVLLS